MGHQGPIYHATATGAAKITVDYHQTPQDLIFWAGWASVYSQSKPRHLTAAYSFAHSLRSAKFSEHRHMRDESMRLTEGYVAKLDCFGRKTYPIYLSGSKLKEKDFLSQVKHNF